MKRVQVKLYATLRRYGSPESQRSGGAFPVELNNGAHVRDLLAVLKISDSETKLIFVNGQRGKPGQRLRDGDDVAIFPPIAGGR